MRTALIARRFVAPLTPEIPKNWLPGAPALSAILNTYTILVPANEAFYMRTLNHSLPRIRSQELLQAARAFIHQEAEHGVAHKRCWRILEEQGYRFRGFERSIDRLTFRLIERIFPLSMRLSMVSCVEYVNAFFAFEFLSQKILADAHPQMRALIEWHFAEEIEHKTVAFDVLNAVSSSYLTRVGGMLMTIPLFYALMTLGMIRFLWQDRLLHKPAVWRQFFRHLGTGHGMFRRTLGYLFAYVKPSFHPSAIGGEDLASDIIERYSSPETNWIALANRQIATEQEDPVHKVAA